MPHVQAALVPTHPFHPATELPVVLYDVATATPLTPFAHAAPFAPSAPAFPQRQGQQVQVASAAPAVHLAAASAFHPLLPFLAIFAVPVRVRVQSTYIAYQAGSSVNVVLTVKLL